MTEIYSFVFSMGLGIAARLLYMLTSLISKKTDLIPVTVILDLLTVAAVGAAFAAYIILTGTVIAPYMFACLGTGYFVTYILTVKSKKTKPEKKQKARR